MFGSFPLVSPSSQSFLDETAAGSSQTAAAAAADGEQQPAFRTRDLNLQRHSTPQRPLHATKPFLPPRKNRADRLAQSSCSAPSTFTHISRTRWILFFPPFARGSISIYSILTAEKKSLASGCLVKPVTETSNAGVTATAYI